MSNSEDKEQYQISSNIDHLKRLADDSRIKAMLNVWIEQLDDGHYNKHILAVAPGEIDKARIDTIMQCLHGIAEALHTTYEPPVAVASADSNL